MGEKLEKARAYKAAMRKWENSALTKEDIEGMNREDKIYKQLAREATEEWLTERKMQREIDNPPSLRSLPPAP